MSVVEAVYLKEKTSSIMMNRCMKNHEGVKFGFHGKKTSSFMFMVIRSSSLGTMCHRDEDLVTRYKDRYEVIMEKKGKVKGLWLER